MPKVPVNPFESFTLVPSDHGRDRISIYSDAALSTASKADPNFNAIQNHSPDFTLFLPHRSYISLPSWWPWAADPKISLMAQNPPVAADPLQQPLSLLHQATISEPLLATHLCSVGTVSVAPSSTTPQLKPPITSFAPASLSSSNDPQTSTPQASKTSLLVSSGLGHGMWFDEILPSLLRLSNTTNDLTSEKDPNPKPPRAIWYACPRGFDHEDSPAETEWSGLPETQKPKRGAIMVRDGGRDGGGDGAVIALYRPRGPPPQGGRAEDAWGRLGVCVDFPAGVGEDRDRNGDGARRRESVVRHLLMVAVGIEEQIRRSRGFQGLYHGRWAG